MAFIDPLNPKDEQAIHKWISIAGSSDFKIYQLIVSKTYIRDDQAYHYDVGVSFD